MLSNGKIISRFEIRLNSAGNEAQRESIKYIKYKMVQNNYNYND